MNNYQERTFAAHMQGRINQCDFQLEGKGIQGGGVCRGNYTANAVPDKFDLLLLNSFLMLGYPDIHRPMPGAVNPFANLSEYRYTRKLDLGERGQLEVSTAHTIGASHAESQFVIEGDVNLPKLNSVLSVRERWISSTDGEMHNDFPMHWVTESGDIMSGNVTSHYVLPDVTDLPEQALWQALISISSNNNLEIIQDSILWRTEPTL